MQTQERAQAVCVNAMINAEWRNRPADQRFLTLDALYEHTKAAADRRNTVITTTKRIQARAIEQVAKHVAVVGDIKKADEEYALILETEGGYVDMTHWSFGQLARTIKTPADYLRRIDPRKAAKDIDYGLTFLTPKEEYSLWNEQVEGRGELGRLVAMTGTGYGRLYDYKVVDMVRNAADPNVWQPPSHNYSGERGSLKATTLYASDRDMTIFLCDDQNPLEITVGAKREVLSRGFVVRNSDVGLSTFELFLFFYRYDCDNRLIWSPSEMKQLSIRHTSGAPERFEREGVRMLEEFAAADTKVVRDRIERAMRLEIGRDRETVVGWLGRHGGIGSYDAGRAYERALEEEGQAVTVWDLIQGGTAMARAISNNDSRISKEQEWGGLLNRLVA